MEDSVEQPNDPDMADQLPSNDLHPRRSAEGDDDVTAIEDPETSSEMANADVLSIDHAAQPAAESHEVVSAVDESEMLTEVVNDDVMDTGMSENPSEGNRAHLTQEIDLTRQPPCAKASLKVSLPVAARVSVRCGTLGGMVACHADDHILIACDDASWMVVPHDDPAVVSDITRQDEKAPGLIDGKESPGRRVSALSHAANGVVTGRLVTVQGGWGGSDDL